MFEELRRDLPALPHSANLYEHNTWIAACRQVVRAMTTEEQRWAACVILADDLMTLRYPSLPLAFVYGWLQTQILDIEEP
jgi:hypothetical protein